MEDKLGITTPDIWFSFFGQSLSFLFPRSLFIDILTYSNNNSRKPYLSWNRIPKRIQPDHGLLAYLFAVILNTDTKLTRDIFGNAIFKEVSEKTSMKWSLLGGTECTSYPFSIEWVHYSFFFFRKREVVLKIKFQKINVLYRFSYLHRFVFCCLEWSL